MTIDPKAYMLKLQGREYLPVAPRVVMFREEHPDWAIVTELVPGDDAPKFVKAYVQDAGGNIIATAHKTIVSFKGGDVEKAETGAIGRALSLTGYGTIAAQDLDEGEQISDAPVSNGRRVADEDKPHPRKVKTPEQATAQMAEEDAAVESWRKAIEATDDQDALVDMLGAIHEERNNFRRVGALRIWAKMLAEVGDVAHIKTAGAAVKAWPEGTVGRSEVLSILTAAYKQLTDTAKSEDAA